VIPQAKLGSDLQTKIPDRIPGLAASIAMVGSSHRTGIELGTGSAYGAIEDRMERTTGGIVTAQYTVVYGTMALGQ